MRCRDSDVFHNCASRAGSSLESGLRARLCDQCCDLPFMTERGNYCCHGLGAYLTRTHLCSCVRAVGGSDDARILVIISRCICKTAVVAKYMYIIPLLRRSAVIYGSEARATTESITADARDGARNADAGEARATRECIRRNGGYTAI